MEITKYILFKLNDQPFVINIEQVMSIEKWQKITSVPKSSRFIKGVAKLRGQTTPIIDLKERLMQQEVELTDEARILVVFIDGMQIGLTVDAATEVIDIANEAIEPAPKLLEGVDSTFIKGVANAQGQLIILINAEKVINLKETEELQEVIEDEGQADVQENTEERTGE